MVTNVTSLLKTVKTVEDESARGLQALESSIEVIGQEMKVICDCDYDHDWFFYVFEINFLLFNYNRMDEVNI